jgi:hypothetical protein
MRNHLGMLLFVTLFAFKAKAQVSVTTQHNDLSRTGWNSNEKILNLKNVNSKQFGKAFTRRVDDQIYAQPLVISNLSIGGSLHNVVFVATVNNSVYAFDADSASAQDPFWQVNLTAASKRPILFSDMTGACGGNYNNFSSHMGIVGTPVIDTTSKILYVVARSVDYNGFNFVQYLHALDITTGVERPGSPVRITAQVPGHGDGSVNGVLSFEDQKENQRPGLLLSNGTVYIGFASHCDWGPYHGWLLGYDAATLQQTVVYTTTPDGGEGGIWMSGAAPAADEAGNIFVATGNGTVDASTNNSAPRNTGESILKLNRNGAKLEVASYFTPYNYESLNNADLDMGCFQVLLFPGSRFLVSGDKNGDLYLLNRDTMGGFHGTINNVLQGLNIGPYSNLHASLGYYRGSKEFMYVWSENAPLFAYPFDRVKGLFNESERLTGNYGPIGQTGGFLATSSDGNDDSTAILWASYPSGGDAEVMTTAGILRAFSAADINREIWNSSIDPDDQPSSHAKFVCPTIANGKVYLATQTNELVVYGLVSKSAGSCDQPNVALLKKASTTSVEYPDYPGNFAFDGNLNTRWSSQFEDNQNLDVDLGSQFKICKMVIRWEVAYGRDFSILYSSDGVYWRTAKDIIGNTSMTNAINVDFTARYVRMQGIHRATPYGFSIWEWEIFGKAVIDSDPKGAPRIFPNPASDYFSVLKGDESIIRVDVHDAVGHLMSSVENLNGSKEVEVPVRSYSKGIYMVTVTTASKKYNIKIVH